jgi:hypothetical protein
MSKEYFVQTEESKWAVDLTGEVIERAALKA